MMGFTPERTRAILASRQKVAELSLYNSLLQAKRATNNSHYRRMSVDQARAQIRRMSIDHSNEPSIFMPNRERKTRHSVQVDAFEDSEDSIDSSKFIPENREILREKLQECDQENLLMFIEELEGFAELLQNQNTDEARDKEHDIIESFLKHDSPYSLNIDQTLFEVEPTLKLSTYNKIRLLVLDKIRELDPDFTMKEFQKTTRKMADLKRRMSLMERRKSVSSSSRKKNRDSQELPEFNGAFKAETTFTSSPETALRRLSRRIKNKLVNYDVEISAQSKSLLARCPDLEFKIDIVSVPRLEGLRGLRFTRIAGDPWKYKDDLTALTTGLRIDRSSRKNSGH